jgi:hypothetical protein
METPKSCNIRIVDFSSNPFSQLRTFSCKAAPRHENENPLCATDLCLIFTTLLAFRKRQEWRAAHPPATAKSLIEQHPQMCHARVASKPLGDDDKGSLLNRPSIPSQALK